MKKHKFSFFFWLVQVTICTLLGVMVWSGYYLFIDLETNEHIMEHMPRLLMTIAPGVLAIWMGSAYSEIRNE